MRKNGFTLMELLSVIAIMGLLAAVVIIPLSRHEHSLVTVNTAQAAITVREFGRGVYLLRAVDHRLLGMDDFASALTQFLQEHPALEVVSMAPRQHYDSGYVVELLVVVREQ